MERQAAHAEPGQAAHRATSVADQSSGDPRVGGARTSRESTVGRGPGPSEQEAAGGSHRRAKRLARPLRPETERLLPAQEKTLDASIQPTRMTTPPKPHTRTCEIKAEKMLQGTRVFYFTFCAVRTC